MFIKELRHGDRVQKYFQSVNFGEYGNYPVF